jgi:N-acylglucosamine 2-epimerase
VSSTEFSPTHRPASATTRRIAEQARVHLNKEIIPFWFPQAIDHEDGGFFTCYDNSGNFVSDLKYTWSQGRFVAVCAQLAEAAAAGLVPLDQATLVEYARRGAVFLRDHALRPDGTTRYVLSRRGEPVESPGASVYADCFAIMGFAAMARVSGEKRWLAIAEHMTEVAWQTAAQSPVPTAPYQMPAGTKVLGVHMILLNVELDLAQARATLGLAPEPGGLQRAVTGLVSMARPDGGFDEVGGGGLAADSLLATHRTPGHALEGMWMLARANQLIASGPSLGQLVDWTLRLCELGWDEEFGGLFRYVAATGGRPAGGEIGIAYESLVNSTWDTKLWWVHSEASWTLTLLAELSGDDALAAWRDRVWEYTRATFPGRDEGKEWIQIRDRAGRPLNQVVALPLKDPYHITRNLIQLATLGAPAATPTQENQ